MVSEPKKIEEFGNLDDDTGPEDPLEDTAPAEVEAVEEVEEIEGLEPMVDEAPEMMFSKQEQEIREEEVRVKYCLFCREIIPAEAIACKSCGHVVHIFEGNVFKQLYWFFWGGVIAFVGTLLPYYSGELTLVTACTTFTGALFLIFSLLLLAAMAFSIYAKRLIMSPVFLMFIPAIVTWWTLVKRVGGAPESYSWYDFFYDIDAINWLSNDAGSGLLLIMLGSTIVVLTFIVSIITAVAGGGKEKSAERSPAKGRGRRR
jgi:hypothetical protein